MQSSKNSFLHMSRRSPVAIKVSRYALIIQRSGRSCHWNCLRVLTQLERRLLSCSVSSLCHLRGFLIFHLQAFGFGLVEFHHIFVTPFLQPVWVTLGDTCAFEQIAWCCSYSVNYRLGDSVLLLLSCL